MERWWQETPVRSFSGVGRLMGCCEVLWFWFVGEWLELGGFGSPDEASGFGRVPPWALDGSSGAWVEVGWSSVGVSAAVTEQQGKKLWLTALRSVGVEGWLAWCSLVEAVAYADVFLRQGQGQCWVEVLTVVLWRGSRSSAVEMMSNWFRH